MFLHVNGLNVHVQVDGPIGGTPLLLLHSLGTSGHVWDAQARALSGSYRVIRPDLRGQGLTECTPGPYSIAGLATDMWAVLDALRIEHVNIAGLSVGGMVAQAMAASAPERAASLVLCSTALAIPPAGSWRGRAAEVRAGGTAAVADAVMARWVTDGYRTTPEAAGLRAMLLRTAPEGYAATAEAIAAADLTEATKALKTPTLVLVGDADEATPPASAAALRDAIAGSTLMIIPRAAHIPTVERAEEVTSAIRTFLSYTPTDFLQAGMQVRRQVLGEAHVSRANAAVTRLDRDFQAFITRTAWGGVWTRPHFDRRLRSILTLSLMAALGHHEEFKLHVRATRNTGTTPEDLAELLIHVAAYAGIPAANTAVRLAKETLAEMEQGQG